MILGFLDFEATGIDPKQADIIEFAVMTYDTELKQVVKVRTSLVANATVIPEEVVEITGITGELVKKGGIVLGTALEVLGNVLKECDYVVAHNGLDYDKVLYEAQCQRINLRPVEKPWIDSRYDLPFPDKIKDRKLVHLAAAHGFVNPMAHRALSDVMTLQHLFSMYELPKILEISATRLITIRADVSYANKDEAKKRGFYWDGERKIWFKKIREFYYEKESKAPFKVIQI